MTPAMIPFEAGQERLDWLDLVTALQAGHQAPKAEIEDLFLYRGRDTLLSRSAWIDGMGLLTKTATVFPGNRESGQPMIGGGVMLFDDATGELAAVIDFHLITKWKTAGDSLMAALALAPAGAREILIVGAGTVGRSLVEAFSAGFPRPVLASGTEARRRRRCLRKTPVPVWSRICKALSWPPILF